MYTEGENMQNYSISEQVQAGALLDLRTANAQASLCMPTRTIVFVKSHLQKPYSAHAYHVFQITDLCARRGLRLLLKTYFLVIVRVLISLSHTTCKVLEITRKKDDL